MGVSIDNMVLFRKATPEDAVQVFTLFSRLESRKRTGKWNVNQATGKDVYHRILANPELGVIIVAVDGEDLLGVITLSYPVAIRSSGKYARIEEYIVDEKARGKGVGSGLLASAIDTASSSGCYDLQVNNPSDLGKAVYAKQGFIDGGEYWRKKL